MSGPIQEVELRLRQLVDAISQQAEMPSVLTRQLVQACQCLTRYVLEMDYQKRKMADAWAELERQ